MERCAVTEDLNRYLARYDEAEAREDAVEARMEELMEKGQEYYPFSIEHLAEALSEMSRKEFDRLSQFLTEPGGLQKAGAVVSVAVETYWEEQARKQAEKDVDGEWDSCRCHGRGCRRCQEDDE